MITYVMVLLMSTNPPVFAFLKDHTSLEDCVKSIEKLNVTEEQKKAVGCMAVMPPSNSKSV